MEAQRILIIDDEERIRDTIRFALEAVGYRTATAADGEDGLAQFGGGESWDLVLLDQRMPGMEGLEVLRQIRERNPAARVLMATAYGTIELAVDAMKAGAVDFLRKPFTPEVLRGAVAAALAQPRAPAATESISLGGLMPTVPSPRTPQDLPLIHFRTLNGYKLWSMSLPEGAEETEALRIRRAFEAEAPSGERSRCVVEVTTSVREWVRAETGQDFDPASAMWDTLCRSALSNQLWQEAELPPDVLPVYQLTREQAQVVRAMAGVVPGSRR